MTDPAHIMFPSDRPADQTQAAAAPQARQADPASALAAAQPQAGEEAAARLFASEVRLIERDSALESLDTLAEAVRRDGDTERAVALTEAGDLLAAEAQAHEMPSADLAEIVSMVHGASATVAPMTEAQLADLNAKAERELADLPASDLAAGRALIQQMSQKMPTLIYQLEASGLGSDPKFVRAVCREAARRRAR